MELTVPGDKSLTHRALLLAALAEGESRLSGLLTSEDPRSTAACLRALGVEVPPLPEDGSELTVRGLGLRGLRSSQGPLDAGNSGTTARLLLGVLAGSPVKATLTGDRSLCTRPMERVTRPLSQMGAEFESLREPGRLPLRVRGGTLEGGALESIAHTSAVASAQVKSAVLLAGLVGRVPVSVHEPRRSRDHTERLFEGLGVPLTEGPDPSGGWSVGLGAPPERIPPLDLRVPGDFSSAAFFIALALLGGGGAELVLRNVGLNPTRSGLLRVLERMGAGVEVEDDRMEGRERVGTLVCRPGSLRATDVGEAEIPDLIDEIPVLCVLAARAEGRTRISGAQELRVKESDRIDALARGLTALGVEIEEFEDGLVIEGTPKTLEGRVESFGDHRIAMAFGILGRSAGVDARIEGRSAADVSFPGFWSLLDEVARSGGS